MYIRDALTHYGTKTAIAKAIGRTKAAVSNWDDSDGALVPLVHAFLLERDSRGALTVDLPMYQSLRPGSKRIKGGCSNER